MFFIFNLTGISSSVANSEFCGSLNKIRHCVDATDFNFHSIRLDNLALRCFCTILPNFESFCLIILPPWTQCCNGELSVSVLSTRRRRSPRIPSFKECDPAKDSKRFVEVTSSHVSACFSFLRRPRLRGPPLWERDTSCFNSCGKFHFYLC